MKYEVTAQASTLRVFTIEIEANSVDQAMNAAEDIDLEHWEQTTDYQSRDINATLVLEDHDDA